MAEKAPVSLDELYELVEENLKLAEDTNRILRDVRRTGRIAFWAKVILWTLVLALPFIFIGPILDYLEPFFQGVSPSLLLGVPSQEQVQQAVEAYKGFQAQNPGQ